MTKKRKKQKKKSASDVLSSPGVFRCISPTSETIVFEYHGKSLARAKAAFRKRFPAAVTDEEREAMGWPKWIWNFESDSENPWDVWVE